MSEEFSTVATRLCENIVLEESIKIDSMIRLTTVLQVRDLMGGFEISDDEKDNLTRLVNRARRASIMKLEVVEDRDDEQVDNLTRMINRSRRASMAKKGALSMTASRIDHTADVAVKKPEPPSARPILESRPSLMCMPSLERQPSLMSMPEIEVKSVTVTQVNVDASIPTSAIDLVRSGHTAFAVETDSWFISFSDRRESPFNLVWCNCDWCSCSPAQPRPACPVQPLCLAI